MKFPIRVSETALDEIDVLRRETGFPSMDTLFTAALAVYITEYMCLDQGATILVQRDREKVELLETALGVYLFPKFAVKGGETDDFPFTPFRLCHKGETVRTMQINPKKAITRKYWLQSMRTTEFGSQGLLERSLTGYRVASETYLDGGQIIISSPKIDTPLPANLVAPVFDEKAPVVASVISLAEYKRRSPSLSSEKK